MPTRFETLLAIPLMLVLGGCPIWGSGNGGGSDGACRTPGDCGVGLTCDVGSGSCVSSPTCTTDASCGAGRVCDSRGTCVTPTPGQCRTSSDCANGEVCIENSCRGTGVETCQFDIECGAGRTCVNNACVNTCTSSSQCGSGQNCVDNRCVNAVGECTTSDDCPGKEACIDGRCLPPCGSGESCSDAQDACDADGFCHPDWQPAVFCSRDADCASGSVCEIALGICRIACDSSSPLVMNYTPGPGCVGNVADCACRTADAQLPTCGRTTADWDNDYCRTAAEGSSDCATKADCPANQSCVNGTCR